MNKKFAQNRMSNFF